MLPPGEAGEVQLLGPQVTRGYWRAPEVTRAAFHEGWLRTGDLGVMDEEGYLQIVDRLKDLLKFRGWSISPNTIEECLLLHPAVAEAVVVGKQDPVDGDLPVAFVVPRQSVGADELQGHCRERLAAYQVPRMVLFVQDIPKNAVGKPLRRTLRDRLNRSL
jgi:long-chain acyl-CoA synthetase